MYVGGDLGKVCTFLKVIEFNEELMWRGGEGWRSTLGKSWQVDK